MDQLAKFKNALHWPDGGQTLMAFSSKPSEPRLQARKFLLRCPNGHTWRV